MKLSLDATSKAAEIIAAVGVVLSLIYVGYQVQQNTKAIQSSVHHSLIDNVITTEGAVLNDPEFADLVVKSWSDWDALTPSEQLRAETYLNFSFNNWESAYLNYERGFIEKEIWQTWDRSNYPDEDDLTYFRYWVSHRDWFNDRFAEHVDKVFADRGYKATGPNGPVNKGTG